MNCCQSCCLHSQVMRVMKPHALLSRSDATNAHRAYKPQEVKTVQSRLASQIGRDDEFLKYIF